MSSVELEDYLFKLAGFSDVYYIGEDYIGDLSLRQAIDHVFMGLICIIYCGEGVGYYQGEQEEGAPPRYILLAGKE